MHRGSVYTEDRTVTAAAGPSADRFAQWDVHVYHFVEPLILRKVAPTRATVGSRVTLKGKGLAAATDVSFGGTKAHFRIAGDRKLVATVPKQAQSGSIVVTSPLKQVTTRTTFPILPSVATPPRITGTAHVGHRLEATTGVWYGDTPTSYSYRWLTCNRHALGCRPVPGAASRTLELGPGQLGRRLRVLVTVRTESGSADARSAATAAVKS